jgi:hypothetical protein
MVLEATRLGIDQEALIDDTLAGARFCFEYPPEDLRACITEQQLAPLVENCVERVTHNIDGQDYTRARQVLLGVLTYFYAIGVYRSDEIAAALANNPSADSLHPIAFQHSEPQVVLRRFRRAHRVAVESCLCDVLRTVWPHGSNADLEIETNRRVMNAIQADSCALDF